MEEEVSTMIRIGVLFIMLGAFVSICLNVAIMSTVLMNNEANRYGDARYAGGSSAIIQLQDYPRNYFDLVRIKHEQEEMLNSIILESADGSERYILFLRSTQLVNNEHTRTAIVEQNVPGNDIVNIDYIDANFDSETYKKLIEIRESGVSCYIHVYACKDGSSFDVYGELAE